MKLDKLEDGTILDKETGDDLFVWVWRHPNVTTHRGSDP